MPSIGQNNSISRVQSTDLSVSLNNQTQGSSEQTVSMQRDSISGLSSNLKNNRKGNDNIFFVGLNDTANLEVKNLQKTTVGKITAVNNTTAYDIVLNGKKFNTANMQAFRDLNITDTQFEKLRDFLADNFMANIFKSDNLAFPTTKTEFKSIIDKIGLPEKLSNDLCDQITTKTGPLVKTSSGKTYNLNFKEDIADFSKTLGLNEQQTKDIEKFLSSENITPVAKDELAQIITEFAKAEKGESIPSRLVISSHSDGQSYFGTGDKGFLGRLEMTNLKEIARILPKAAEQIEDISASACNGGHASHLEQFKEIFPNLKTFMGYAGSAPGSVSGAESHLKKWEELTRGDKQVIEPKAFQNFRKGENVSTWTEKGGFKLDSSKQIEKNVSEFVHSSGYIVDDYFYQDRPVKDNQHGELRTVYTNIQLVLGNNTTLSPDDKKKLTELRDRSLRLLFFTDVSKKFNSTYSLQIEKGYKALGLNPIDFSTLSRAQSREAVKNYQEKHEALVNEMKQVCTEKTNAGGSEADIQKIKDSYADNLKNAKDLEDLLEKGLILLSPTIIPENWV